MGSHITARWTKGRFELANEDFAANSLRRETQEAAYEIVRGKNSAEFTEVEQGIFGSVLTPVEQEVWNKKLIGDYINPDALWACTTCGAFCCNIPVNIEHVPAIVGMRRSMVMMESSFNDEAALLPDILAIWKPTAFRGADSRTPTAQTGRKERNADGSRRPRNGCSFWVGCAGSFDERAKKITTSFAELMQIANVVPDPRHGRASCTGDPARRTGNEYLADMLTKMNVETLNTYGVRHIVTTCPHCLNTLKNDYPQFGGNFRVEHHSQFITKLIEAGRLNINRETASAPGRNLSRFVLSRTLQPRV